MNDQVAPRRPALRYHGGKWKLAQWIISFFPAHRAYVESFGGAASVLIRKPRAYAEVYNDVDGEICNFFRILQDNESAGELCRRLTLTPFARREFELAYKPSDDPIECARRLVIRSYMGFGSPGCNVNHSTGFRANSNRSGTTPAHDWVNYPANMPLLIERWRGVVVENRKACDIILQHDGPKTLHYCDPPYLWSVREERQRFNYRHEMSDTDHAEIAAVLRGVKGMVLVSGYASELYRDLFDGWKTVSLAAFADGARPRTETLWLNDALCEALAKEGKRI